MNGPRLALLFVLLAGASPAARAQDEELHILAPLYATPEGDFWSEMVAAAPNTTVKYSVVINPSSGPGDAVEEAYTDGIQELLDAGVEVLCYVPTGFGATDVSEVTADVDTYESFYPGMCDGFFFDEGPGTYENTWKYTEYYTHVQEASCAGSTVVVNPGIQPDGSLYHIGDAYESANPSMGGQVVITSFENNFLEFYDQPRLHQPRGPFPVPVSQRPILALHYGLRRLLHHPARCEDVTKEASPSMYLAPSSLATPWTRALSSCQTTPS